MDTDEKLGVLRWELVKQRYAENTAMVILIEEKIEELEGRKIADMVHCGMREFNKSHNLTS